MSPGKLGLHVGGMQHARAEAKKAAFLTLIAANPTMSVKEACEHPSIHMAVTSYYAWRQDDKDFKMRMMALRAKIARGTKKQTGGTFAEFRETYFPLQYSTPPFHIDMIQKIESAPPMSISMILVPPNHGKSTLLEDWVNYKLALDPNRRITIVSKSQQQSRKMLGRIQRRMTDVMSFPNYIGKYGPFYIDGQTKTGKPWTRDYFTVARADHDERDFSLQVLGWTGQVYGSRVDDLILDDIQTRDNLSSIDEMLNKLSLEFLTRGDEESRTVIIGTRIEVGDIYEQMIDRGMITEGQLFVMPAIHMGPKGEEVPLWGDRWNLERLAIMRKNIGEKAWWCGYQMAPQRGGNATFSEELIERAKDPGRRFGLVRGLPDTPYLPTVVGLDPALGGGNALVAQSYTMDKIYLLDAVREVGLARTEDILERVEDFCSAYRPQDLVIENVAFQRGLARDDRLLALSRRYGFNIHEHATNRNKQDPILGVASMAGTFMRDEYSIPDNDETSQFRVASLIAELLAWRPDIPTKLLTQDQVMAMWFGWLFIQQQRRMMSVDSSVWQRSGLKDMTPFKQLNFPTATLGNGGYL